MPRMPLALAALVPALLSLTPALAQGGDERPARRYRVEYESEMTMDLRQAGGDTMEVLATTEFEYAFSAGARFDVTVERMAVVTSMNGNENMNVSLGRDGLRVVEGGQVREVPYEEADPATRAMIEDGYRHPVATIEVDAEGRERSRALSTRPGARDSLESGSVVNARMFHAPFPADGERWEAEREFSMGSGNVARGALTYTRGAAGPDGRVPVTVSGTLKGAGRQGPLEIRDAVYRVEGTQTFDPALGDWAAGELKIELSMDMLRGGRKLCSATGTILATLERRE